MRHGHVIVMLNYIVSNLLCVHTELEEVGQDHVIIVRFVHT